ncbi:unnamed protein product, partial [Ectocarpus sp. 4 AP-2014]
HINNRFNLSAQYLHPSVLKYYPRSCCCLHTLNRSDLSAQYLHPSELAYYPQNESRLPRGTAVHVFLTTHPFFCGPPTPSHPLPLHSPPPFVVAVLSLPTLPPQTDP